MTEKLTAEQIADQIRKEADLAARPGQMARLNRWADAVLALTEPQPEPVSRDELTHQLRLRHASGFGQVAEDLLSRYTITRKQPEGADHGE